MFENYKVFNYTYAGRPLTVETGKVAGLANGSCMIHYGDTVILAGKGHEDYIIDAFGKHHFSETETVGKIIEKKGL